MTDNYRPHAMTVVLRAGTDVRLTGPLVGGARAVASVNTGVGFRTTSLAAPLVAVTEVGRCHRISAVRVFFDDRAPFAPTLKGRIGSPLGPLDGRQLFGKPGVGTIFGLFTVTGGEHCDEVLVQQRGPISGLR